MSGADAALDGEEVEVLGPHTYTVTTQETVIAKGKSVMIFPPGQKNAEWWGLDTGTGGQRVSGGYRVVVLEATVRFH